jgi:hypothetical protein
VRPCRIRALPSRYQRPARRKFRNVSKNLPETTNLNHQDIFRRVFICASSLGVAPAALMDSAESGGRV